MESKARAAEDRGRGSQWVRLAIWFVPGFVVLLALGALSFWLLRDHPYFHVVAVRVYGTERVSRQELMELAQIRRGVSLWRIDAESIRDRLLRHPWIRDAIVQRLFPNELELIIYERRPSAVLVSHTEHLVDSDGYVLGQFSRQEWPSLTRLVPAIDQSWIPGQQVTEPGVVAGLRILAQIQEQTLFHNIGLSHIEVVNPERFILHTRRGKLVVGANLAAIEHKLVLLSVVEDTLRSKAQRFDAVDLTFANQIVVRASARTSQGTGRLQKRGSGSGQAH